jgi:hypothetical protein
VRGNVSLYYYGDDDPDKIQLMPSNYGQQHMMKAAASIQGPFLTVVTNLDRVNHGLDGDAAKTDRKVNIQIHTLPTQGAAAAVCVSAGDRRSGR